MSKYGDKTTIKIGNAVYSDKEKSVYTCYVRDGLESVRPTGAGGSRDGYNTSTTGNK